MTTKTAVWMNGVHGAIATITVPNDCDPAVLATIICIGAGQAGQAIPADTEVRTKGGNGGHYASVTALLAPSSVLACHLGLGGGGAPGSGFPTKYYAGGTDLRNGDLQAGEDTWLKDSGGTTICLAKGGASVTAADIGTTTFAGGTGYTPVDGGGIFVRGGGGGGGAGGPAGVGLPGAAPTHIADSSRIPPDLTGLGCNNSANTIWAGCKGGGGNNGVAGSEGGDGGTSPGDLVASPGHVGSPGSLASSSLWQDSVGWWYAGIGGGSGGGGSVYHGTRGLGSGGGAGGNGAGGSGAGTDYTGTVTNCYFDSITTIPARQGGIGADGALVIIYTVLASPPAGGAPPLRRWHAKVGPYS